ncbi:hypothetical protein [Thauera sp.]|uniref:hypothetical protein n=1 Tax=Thauera sp. TaxID=1905334 RepID=UPI001B6F2BCD|nr:hypothetical protein [Thauera sp.]MBP6132262.1 hypothetical protein [Thauera sp.]MBP7046190.1 hypothetical protein [Thauera sp.]
MSIRIQADEKVSRALSEAFPTSNVERALKKYITTLEELITRSVVNGRTPEQNKLNLYSLSLHTLSNKGGQIGRDKIRLHKWLEQNKLSLVIAVERGNNLTHKLSQVKLSPLVTITFGNIAQCGSTNSATAQLSSSSNAGRSLVERTYPELETMNSEVELCEIFDLTPINIKSLKAYIDWLKTKPKHLTEEKRLTDLTQAAHILNIATELGGIYLQRRKPSDFGRTYYEGISAQSVRKQLRQAMYGGCWEYDIRSAVISWKLGMGSALARTINPDAKPDALFRNSIYFIDNKPAIVNEICLLTFRKDDNVNEDLQKRIVKQAITAISFGAREQQSGWLKNGSWQNPALVDIIKNPTHRRRFRTCAPIRGFIQEQKLIDQLIYAYAVKEIPSLLNSPRLRTESGRISKPLVIAFLYQHFETWAMDVVKKMVASNGRKVVASIHDAVILDRKLGAELKATIELEMREQTGIPYWHLEGKELEPYLSVSAEVVQHEQAHKRRIREEEQLATRYAIEKAALQAQFSVEQPATDFGRPTPASTVNYPYDIHTWSVENGTAEHPQACFRQAS